MSVHKDKKRGTWYFVVRIDGKQYKRRSAEWTLKRHAVQAEVDFLNNVETKIKKDNELTFQEVSDMYIDFIKLNRKASTITNTEYIAKNHICDFFSNRKIIKITSLDIEKYQKYLLSKKYNKAGVPSGLSNDYLRKIQSLARRIFAYAANHKLIPFSPFELVENASRQELEIKKEMKILTMNEFDTFMSVVDDRIEKTLFSILYWCGLRIGEALALEISDVDFENKTLSITKNYDVKNQLVTTTKTGNVREVSIPDKCMNDINALIAYYDTFDDIEYDNTFPLLGLTRHLAKGTLDRHKNEYIDKSGVDYFTFHELRHTHVSTLIQIGMRDIDIAKRLGHSTDMVNNTYGHLFPKDKETLINKLNSL